MTSSGAHAPSLPALVAKTKKARQQTVSLKPESSTATVEKQGEKKAKKHKALTSVYKMVNMLGLSAPSRSQQTLRFHPAGCVKLAHVVRGTNKQTNLQNDTRHTLSPQKQYSRKRVQ